MVDNCLNIHDEKLPVLAIVVPCFNEEEIIETSCKSLIEMLNSMIEKKLVSSESYICFVDDGSKDKTREHLRNLHEQNKHVKAIFLACNLGQQKALYYGLVGNSADIYITCDCDLQDDISVMQEMVSKYHSESVDVVYGIRKDRSEDSILQRFFAFSYYRISNLLGAKCEFNHAEYRLITKKVVDVLKVNNRYNLYLRGLIYSLGFKSDKIYYKRQKRILGKSKYNFFNMLKYAMNSIISSSDVPIKLLFVISLILFFISIFIKSSVWFLSSLNIFALALVGEYCYFSFIETINSRTYSPDELNFIVERLN